MLQNLLATAAAGAYYSPVKMRVPKKLLPILIGSIGPVCVILLVGFFYATEDWRGWYAWHQFKKEWTAKGESFDFHRYVPAPILDDQNFAMAPVVVTCYAQMIDVTGHEIRPHNTNLVNRLQISCLREAQTGDRPKIGIREKGTLTDLSAWQEYYRHPTNTNSWNFKPNEFPVAAQAQSPAADVLLALSKYDSVIEELRTAAERPLSRFPLEYDKANPAAILLPHLASLKHFSEVLQLRAIAEIQNGQADRAADDVKLMLRLTDSIHNEPILISQLVRIAIVEMAMQPIWEGLTQHRWSDGQLAEFATDLSRLDFLADYRLSMHGEMMFQDGICGYVRHHPDQIVNLGTGGETKPPIPSRIILGMIPKGWFWQNELRCARVMEECYLPAVNVDQRTVDTELIEEAGVAVQTLTKNPGRFDVLANLMLPGLEGVARKFAYAQTSVNLARLACALDRYRVANGQYPNSLEALARRFIEELPRDVIGGEPLIYHLDPDGKFHLYSVGWNEVDDEGDAAFTKKGGLDLTNGDWIWQ